MSAPIQSRVRPPVPVDWKVTVRRYFELKDVLFSGIMDSNTEPGEKLKADYVAAEQELRRLAGA